MSVKISELPYNNSYTGAERIPMAQDVTTRAGTLSSLITYLSSFYFDPIVAGLSSNWNEAYDVISANSTNWDIAYNTIEASEPKWDSTYTTLYANSGTWDGVYSNVRSNSGNWNATYNTILVSGPVWNNTYSTVNGNSARWTSVYNNVQSNSAFYALDSNVVKLTGGTIDGNLTITGNITSFGSASFASTVYSTTSALSIVNVGNFGPALYVSNDGTGDLASFYDFDSEVEVFHIGGANGSNPYTGIRTSSPNKELTVVGDISATGVIWSLDGNSDNWNSVYSHVSSLSTTWLNTLTLSDYLSTNIIQLSSATVLDTLSAKSYINISTGKTIFVDSTSGTDTRSQLNKYDQFKPFATLSAAVEASSAGDLVYVKTGTYSIGDSINLNAKGNLYFDPGSEVTVPTGVTAFTYTQNSASIYIRGYADFVTQGTGALINVSSGNATTSISLQCNSITSAAGTGTLFTAAAGVLSVDASVIRATSATIVNITGSGEVFVKVPYIYCSRYLNAAGGGTSKIDSDILRLEATNATAGMFINSIGFTNLHIVNYIHTGVGVACSWAEDAQVESITFIDTMWNSTNNLSHITATTTDSFMDSKAIKLRGVNTLKGITTTTASISSTLPLNVYVQNSYGATAASSNIVFNVGMFTVDANVNSF